MTLKQLRKEKKLTQAACAKFLGIPVRTYQNYETDPNKQDTMKYRFMLQKLEAYGFVDETHGILTLERIRSVCAQVFEGRKVDFCYLFGSYAKGKATETSDVDLLVSTSVGGMAFFDMVEQLREGLNKKVDVLNQDQLKDNLPLVEEILKDGIKIYG